MNYLDALKGCNAPIRLTVIFALGVVILLAGCRSESGGSSSSSLSGTRTPDIDAELARAASLKKPMLVLVYESGASPADDHARALIKKLSAKGQTAGINNILIDISISRNRATAARFRVTETPLLLCLSPEGLTVSRDKSPITKDLVLQRIGKAAQLGDELDARLKLLQQNAATKKSDPEAQLELADFLLVEGNVVEAIPYFEHVVHDEMAGTTLRVYVWVVLAGAHFSIAEPEKGRHEVQNLIATLGPKSAEAVAGGNFELGSQDLKAKRFTLARTEFDTAIGAAPNSIYAKQAANALAALPAGDK